MAVTDFSSGSGSGLTTLIEGTVTIGQNDWVRIGSETAPTDIPDQQVLAKVTFQAQNPTGGPILRNGETTSNTGEITWFLEYDLFEDEYLIEINNGTGGSVDLQYAVYTAPVGTAPDGVTRSTGSL